MPVQPVDHKITLLGPIPYDHITLWNNELINRYGGIIYPAIALSKLLGRKARITPVANVRKKDQQTIKAILQGHRGVELLRINADYDQGDVMVLKFISKYKCLEKQYGFMNPIMPEDVKHLLDSDYFVALPVSDYEVSLETLQFIKQYSEAAVVFDAHGPTTAMTSLGDRVTKFWVDRDLWLPYIDVLTMTMAQVKYSWFEKEYTLEQLEEIEDLSGAQLLEFAEHCFNQGVKVLYIILPEDGCLVFFQQEDQIVREYVPPASVSGEVIDTAGRSESFAAGVVFGLIKEKDNYIKAAWYGNTLLAQRMRSLGYEVYELSEETEKIVSENYGEE